MYRRLKRRLQAPVAGAFLPAFFFGASTALIWKVFMRNKIAPKSLHLVFGHSEKLFDRYVDVAPGCYKWTIGLDGNG